MKSLALFVAAAFASSPALGIPKPGTPAPPLQFTQLLQAHAGATNWKELRGKVVVLEFWATWCEVCVAELPEFNKLVDSLDPSKFQFISIDDEEPQIVQAFLKKRKIAGWVGIDTTGEIFKRFGILSRPTTVVVNARAEVVAVTHPESLDSTKLQALSEGKRVEFTPLDENMTAATSATRAKPLFELTLTRAEPGGKEGMSTGVGTMDMYQWSADSMIQMVLNNTPSDRLIWSSPAPNGNFNLHAAWASGEVNTPLIVPMLRAAISYGLNLQIEPKTVSRKVLVLTKGETVSPLLVPTAMTNGSWMRVYRKGKMKLINGSTDDLAAGIETGLQTPVVNETGIEGKFDAELEFPEGDLNAAKAASVRILGLDLRDGERPITVYEIRQRETSSDVAKSPK